MDFCDYGFYTADFHGSSIPEGEFERLALRAGAYLDLVTRGRAAGWMAPATDPGDGSPAGPPAGEGDGPAGRAAGETQDGGMDGEQVRQALRHALCAVAEALLLNEQGGGIAGETVGRYRVQYRDAAGGETAPAGRLYEAAALFLARTGLLDRWC